METYAVAVVHRVEVGLVADGTAAAGVPTLTTDKVTAALPLDAVGAASKVGVGDGRLAVRPPREEVAIVSTLLVGGDLALLDVGGSKSAGDGGQGREESGVRDHCEETLEMGWTWLSGRAVFPVVC